MKAGQSPLWILGFVLLGACGQPSLKKTNDANEVSADASLEGENGGQVRVGEAARARSAAAMSERTTDAAVADAASSTSAGGGGSPAAGRRDAPGPRAGGGSGGRSGWPGLSGGPALPFGGNGSASFPRRPRVDENEEDAGSAAAPAADGGTVDPSDGDAGPNEPKSAPPT